MPEPYRSHDWALVPANPASKAEYKRMNLYRRGIWSLTEHDFRVSEKGVFKVISNREVGIGRLENCGDA